MDLRRQRVARPRLVREGALAFGAQPGNCGGRRDEGRLWVGARVLVEPEVVIVVPRDEERRGAERREIPMRGVPEPADRAVQGELPLGDAQRDGARTPLRTPAACQIPSSTGSGSQRDRRLSGSVVESVGAVEDRRRGDRASVHPHLVAEKPLVAASDLGTGSVASPDDAG